jgi:succinoglycan biosynthesis transport protein ExoP
VHNGSEPSNPSHSLMRASALSPAHGPYALATSLPGPAPDREMRVRDYLGAVKRHVWLVCVIVAIVTLPVTGIMMLQPDYYEGKVRIEIGATLNVPDLKDTPPVATPPAPAQFNTQLQFLTSPAMLRNVVQTLRLDREPAFLRHITKGGVLLRRILRLTYFGAEEEETGGSPIVPSIASGSAMAEMQAAKRDAPFVKDLTTRLIIAPVMETRTLVKDTRLVDITFCHPNPLLAAKIPNTLADLFVVSNLTKRSDGQARTSEYLTRRSVGLEAQIRDDEARRAAFGNSHQILSLDAGQNVAVERLMNLNKQLVEVENDRELAQANYKTSIAPDAAKGIAEESARSVLNEATMKLADLRAKRAQLLVGVTESWPEVKEVNQQILTLEQEIKDIRSRAVESAVSSLETKYRQAAAREDAIRAAFQSQKGLVREQNKVGVDAQLIQQRIDVNRDLLKQLLKKLGENDAAQVAAMSDCRVVEYAVKPDISDAAGPWRLAYVLAAFALSLLVGVGTALIREAFDQRLRSSDDVEAAFQVAPIAMIRFGAASPGGISGETKALGLGATHDAGPELLLNPYCSTAFVEDYRRLRTALLLSMRSQPPRTILVTSSVAGEGTTTTAVNLAVSLARTGTKVLLIDANIRRPRICTIFAMDNDAGLSSLLSSECHEQEIFDTIRHDADSGVNVLPAGPPSLNAAELLGSPRMTSLLLSVQASFTHIIIDAPAISCSSDSVILSSMTDAVLLVVQASKTSRELVRQSQSILASVGARLLGVVLNNVLLRDEQPYTSVSANGPSNGTGPSGPKTNVAAVCTAHR